MIRSKNRPVYLAVTLRSLSASQPQDIPTVLFDDVSNNETTQKMLSTPSSQTISLPQPYFWPTSDWWRKAGLAPLPTISDVHGLIDKYTIVVPSRKLGPVGSIFASVAMMMERFSQAPAVIHIEGDVIFSQNWYSNLLSAWNESKTAKRHLGVLGAFDPWGLHLWKHDKHPTWGWISGGKTWTSQMLLFTREFYNRAKASFSAEYAVTQRHADHFVSQSVMQSGLFRAVMRQSLCQHIGIESLCWPGKRILAHQLALPLVFS